MNENGVEETYTLSKHTLSITEGTKEIWTTPKEYSVDSFAFGDINHDGKLELVISLWKTGSFGKLKPFWHKQVNTDYKNHLFVYRIQENTAKQVWCSSNLDRPILSFQVEDWDKDGLKELVVREGEYQKTLFGRYRAVENHRARTAIWKWEEWGFYLETAIP